MLILFSWCKCSRIPFKPSFIHGLCNFLTAMRCQKKNHITRFGGCVRCNKLASKPSYRADCLVFVLVLHLISYCSTFTAAQWAMCKNVAPLVQSNFPHIVSFDVSWWQQSVPILSWCIYYLTLVLIAKFTPSTKKRLQAAYLWLVFGLEMKHTRVVTDNTDPGYIFFGFALYVCWWGYAEAPFYLRVCLFFWHKFLDENLTISEY